MADGEREEKKGFREKNKKSAKERDETRRREEKKTRPMIPQSEKIRLANNASLSR